MALLTINISAQTVPAGPTVFILLGLKHSESAKAFDEKKELKNDKKKKMRSYYPIYFYHLSNLEVN